MSKPAELAAQYAQQVSKLAADPTTAEDTYYPPIVALWKGLLASRGLPLDVRTNTKQPSGSGKGLDRPDIAICDLADTPVVLGEVKNPGADLEDLAVSVEQNDQVGRYLGRSNVVLLCNVWSVGLLTRKAGAITPAGQPVPPGERSLIATVALWPSASALKAAKPIAAGAVDALADLLERAITEFAVLREPRVLARVFARLARAALADLPKIFDAVRPLLDDYRDGLGLSFNEERGEDFFRSSLVQTAFYGLFSAWTVWATEKHPEAFDWRHVGDYLRVPFLKGLFHDFSHPDRLKELRLARHLDRASAVLRKVDHQAFFQHFHAQTVDTALTAQDAALTYFYEPFLESFDPRLREDLGVWYTPPAIVHYQVARIDRLLRDELGCPDGFADERVVVLDPCCGTGAYLLEVLRCIAKAVRKPGEEALVAAEVQRAITSRIIGFEILTAPFVVAHMQIAMFLRDLGLSPKETVRPRVILTNALTGWNDDTEQKFNFPEIRAEHDLARAVKRDDRIVVILGNPPYNAFAGAAMDEEADLVDHYKGVTRKAAKTDAGGAVVRREGRKVLVADGESRLSSVWGVRKQKLDDLYVRFFRLAEERIGQHAEFGIASFISNSSFLTGRSHPIMRESLLGTFDTIWIDNLNGDKYRTGKVIPAGLPGAGTSDQSAFSTADDARGIQVGTAITTMLKRPGHTAPGRLYLRDFWGRALHKRQALVDALAMDAKTLEWREAQARTPEGPRAYGEITPTKASWFRFASGASGEGYEEWPSVKEVFADSFQGVNPNRGLKESIVDVDRARLSKKMRVYFESENLDEVRAALPELMAKRARYEPEEVWRWLRKTTKFSDDHVVRYLLFPFDERWVYYEPSAKPLNERRIEFWHSLKDNEFFFAVPQARRVSEARPLFSRTLADLHLHDRGTVCFPRSTRIGALITAQQANIPEPLWRALSAAYGLSGDRTSPEAIALVGRLFRAALAVMHAPAYGAEQEEALQHDWAHLPIPRDPGAFEALIALGDRIATLLDPTANADAAIAEALAPMTSATLAVMTPTDGAPIALEGEPLTFAYGGAAPGRWVQRDYRDGEARGQAWGERTGDLAINERFVFANVPEGVWEYELGGYPVLKKWLGYRQAKDRDGAPLTIAELWWFRQIVQRVAALLALGPRLDAAYAVAVPNAFSAVELGVRAA